MIVGPLVVVLEVLDEFPGPESLVKVVVLKVLDELPVPVSVVEVAVLRVVVELAVLEVVVDSDGDPSLVVELLSSDVALVPVDDEDEVPTDCEEVLLMEVSLIEVLLVEVLLVEVLLPGSK